MAPSWHCLLTVLNPDQRMSTTSCGQPLYWDVTAGAVHSCYNLTIQSHDAPISSVAVLCDFWLLSCMFFLCPCPVWLWHCVCCTIWLFIYIKKDAVIFAGHRPSLLKILVTCQGKYQPLSIISIWFVPGEPSLTEPFGTIQQALLESFGDMFGFCWVLSSVIRLSLTH